MAVMRKTDFEKLTDKEAVSRKITELERAMLELRSEGNGSKTRPLRKSVARLKSMLSSTKAAPKPK